MKLWDKGFVLDKQIEDYTVGDDYILDQKLVSYDCLASIAHVKMLQKIKVLNKNELQLLIQELENISKLSRQIKKHKRSYRISCPLFEINGTIVPWLC